MALQIELGCAVLLMGLPLTTEAAPVYWESDFGPALFALTGEDRAVENVVELCVPDGRDGLQPRVCFDRRLSQLARSCGLRLRQSACVRSAELDRSADCAFFRRSRSAGPRTGISRTLGDRAVFTWNAVGSWVSPSAQFSFQVTLLPSGVIRFSYNGIPDTRLHLDTNLLIGTGPGGGAAGTDLSRTRHSPGGITTY